MEIASIVASFVSLIVGIIAGGLAIYFFNKQKDDANRVEVALAAIREQTNALQSISTGFLDRLTKYVTTTPRQPRDPSRTVIDALKELPAVVQMLQITSTTTPSPPDQREFTLMLVALQYYIAETNFWASLTLPATSEFNANDDFHSLVKMILDRSNADLSVVANTVSERDLTCIRGTTIEPYHRDTLQFLASIVGDTAFHWIRRERGTEQESAAN